jgi:hypothetical protein
MAPEVGEDLVALDEALELLAKQDAEAAELGQLRFFAGLTSAPARPESSKGLLGIVGVVDRPELKKTARDSLPSTEVTEPAGSYRQGPARRHWKQVPLPFL